MNGGPMCAVIAVLISEHKYGTPLPEDDIVSKAAVEHDGDAKTAFDDLQQKPFVRYNPARGMILDNSYFGQLADFLYYRCDWSKIQIESRLKHYEGWKNHDWY